MIYIHRLIDEKLTEWKNSEERKPLLIRGARQVGKSSAVRELGKQFQHFIEINLERDPDFADYFTKNINVRRICDNISATVSKPIIPGETLLFIDEIQVSKEAIMSLRYFKEEYPELHVIAAGSLLEFTLEELPSFGVGRIRSLYMYPFSFDEFLYAQELDLMVDYKKKANAKQPMPTKAHKELIEQLKNFYLIGGMPAAVKTWVKTHNFLDVSNVHHDILDTYQDDFSKYKKRVNPLLLRTVLRSVALQGGQKFVYAQAQKDIRAASIKEALHLLSLAGLITPVKHTHGNGLPLGAEENDNYTKYLFFDIGIMMTMLGIKAETVLMSSETEMVNKGPLSEMFAGLEMCKYDNCHRKAELHYWQNTSKNGNAEIDYLLAKNGTIMPIEVKASCRGGMQSLWLFLNKKNLNEATRISLENFGQITHANKENPAQPHTVNIIPLYAISNLYNQ